MQLSFIDHCYDTVIIIHHMLSMHMWHIAEALEILRRHRCTPSWINMFLIQAKYKKSTCNVQAIYKKYFQTHKCFSQGRSINTQHLLAVSSVCVCGLPIWQAFYTEHGCFHCTKFLERGDFVSSLYWNTKYKCTMFCPLNESSVGAGLGGTAYSCFCLINPHQHTVDGLAVSQL